jgi:hypothetical protein
MEIMARPRKSRLVPSLATFAEELVRILSQHTERVVDGARVKLEREIATLRREVTRLRAASANGSVKRGGRPRSARACSVAGCGQPHVARGLCKNHYQQLRYKERLARTNG